MPSVGGAPAGVALAVVTCVASASAPAAWLPTLWAQAAPDTSQAPAATKRQPLVVRIGVDLVQIDAVVTDKKGRHITDLTADDFEILQDKKVRPASHCRYVVAETAPAALPRASSATSVSPHDAPPARGTALRPDEVKRSMAFVVDALSPTGAYATRQALRKLVNEGLRVGDLVAIVRARGGMGILQQFTSDRRQLDAAVDAIVYSPVAGAWNGGRPGVFGDWEPRNEAASLSAITFVLEGLRELPGRKSVVVFSEGLSLHEHTDGLGRPAALDAEIIDAVRSVTDLANRSSVVIYTVDPGGLRTSGFSAADRWGMPNFRPPQSLSAALSDSFGASSSGPAAFSEAVRWETNARLDAQSGLETLARQTGGLFFPEANRVSTAVAAVVEDQKGYYVLGFTPDDRTFERSARGGPLFHNLKVRVKREGLRVRTRAGFIGVTDEDDARPAPRSTQDQMLRAMVSPFTANEIPVRVTAVFGHDPEAGYVVGSLVHVDGSHLTFTPRADGRHDVALSLTAALFGGNGELARGAHHDVTFGVLPGSLERLRQDGVVFHLDVPVEKPGPYQLRVALHDATSAATGTAHEFVHVPDLAKRRLALSGLIVGSDTSLTAATSPVAPAVRVALDPGRSGPAVRGFAAGAELSYAFAVYHATLDRDLGRPRLRAVLRLVRDGEEVVNADITGSSRLTALAPSSGKSKGPKVPGYMAVGTYRLPASLTPGDYALQIVVTDLAAKKSALTSGRWSDLEILAGEPARSSAR